MRGNFLVSLLLLGCTNATPGIHPLPEARGLHCDFGSGVAVIRDEETWQAFVARQPSEQALRLRGISIDFGRESFVVACHTVGSGSTSVRFGTPRMEAGRLLVEARTSTPSGPVRADVVRHCYVAIVEQPDLRAALVVDGRRVAERGAEAAPTPAARR